MRRVVDRRDEPIEGLALDARSSGKREPSRSKIDHEDCRGHYVRGVSGRLRDRVDRGEVTVITWNWGVHVGRVAAETGQSG